MTFHGKNSLSFGGDNDSGDSWLLMEMVHDRCSTLLSECSTALNTILPIFSSIVINVVIVTAGTFEP